MIKTLQSLFLILSIVTAFNVAQAKRTSDTDSLEIQRRSDGQILAAPASLLFFIDCLKVSTAIACNKQWGEMNASLNTNSSEYENLRVGLVNFYKVEKKEDLKNNIKVLLEILDSNQKEATDIQVESTENPSTS